MELDFIERARQLSAAGAPFVIATVVRVEKPTSARPGARALIDAAGELSGWVGGSCAEPVVRRYARQAILDGQPRLLRLTPPEKRREAGQDGVIEVPMSCASGGVLEIFIEPQLPQARLAIIGHLPVAQALAGLGKSLGLAVLVAGLDATAERFPQADRIVNGLDFTQLGIRPGDFVVVASHGNYDEEAITAALEAGAAYVALVSSKARGRVILGYLRASGLPEDSLARLKYPAGLDLGAETPEEIALSILAEIVQLRRKQPAATPAGSFSSTNTPSGESTPAPGDGTPFIPAEVLPVSGAGAADTAVANNPNSPASDLPAERPVSAPGSGVAGEARDPVCGMAVEIASARYMTKLDGEIYYFCARSCQHAFEADPHKYRGVGERG